MASAADRLAAVQDAIDARVLGRPAKVMSPDGTSYELASLGELRALEAELAQQAANEAAGGGSGGAAYQKIAMRTFESEGGM